MLQPTPTTERLELAAFKIQLLNSLMNAAEFPDPELVSGEARLLIRDAITMAAKGVTEALAATLVAK